MHLPWRGSGTGPDRRSSYGSPLQHAGLPNRSETFRLSTDIRIRPGSTIAPVVGHIDEANTSTITLRSETGEQMIVSVDEAPIVRGPKGMALNGDDQAGVLLAGANVIAVPDADGRAKLIRSVSRTYIDLPASWFETLPANGVQ